MAPWSLERQTFVWFGRQQPPWSAHRR